LCRGLCIGAGSAQQTDQRESYEYTS
jgi:hypothetical protein